ncbi:MAG: hypothetical protein KGZ72_11880 [Roseovarius sp.]|nr:hypothetical protein [Roseovarius sp.]
MSRLRILSIPVLALAVVVLLLAGSAAAYFTAEGDGQGDASTTTLEDLTVVGSVSTSLHPGGTADLVLDITNPNGFPVSVDAVVAAVEDVEATGGVGTCDVPDLSFTEPDAAALAALGLLAADDETEITLEGALSMGAAAQSGCQGASFDVPVTVEVVR